MDFQYNHIPSPCYVLEETRFIRNLECIHSIHQKTGIDILLALKGFGLWAVFPLIKKYIQGVAASSVNEALLANKEMGCLCHTYGPAFSVDQFVDLLPLSSHITFNSFHQMHSFLPIVKKKAPDVSIGIRINPGYSPITTEIYNPCATGTRLGISSKAIRTKIPDDVEGLHFHALCESSAQDLSNLIDCIETKFSTLLSQVKWVNIGGGHLVTGKDYDIKQLIDILIQFQSKWNVKIFMEPSSAFAWETGFLLTTVLDIVESDDIYTAVLDASFAAHMPDCLEMPYKPKIINGMDETPGKPTYRLGGNTCLAGDYMGNWSFEKPLQVGDHVIFKDMMHYTMVKTNMFNGVNHPSIGIIRQDNEFELIREFDYFDYRNRLS